MFTINNYEHYAKLASIVEDNFPDVKNLTTDSYKQVLIQVKHDHNFVGSIQEIIKNSYSNESITFSTNLILINLFTILGFKTKTNFPVVE